jgi:hypothetical protein
MKRIISRLRRHEFQPVTPVRSDDAEQCDDGEKKLSREEEDR